MRNLPSIPHKLILIVVLGVAMPACTLHEIKRQTPVVVADQASTMDYLVYLPPAYDDPENSTEDWPVLFVLHGIVQSGNDLRKLPKYGPARQIELGRDFPFAVISPQMNDVAWNVERTIEFIEYCMAHYRIDPRRVYLTGVSLGGRAVWSVAAARPDLFAAIAPVAGWGKEDEAEATAQIPAQVFHGGRDPLIWVSAAKKMQTAHQAAGGDSELTIFPDAGHTIWDQVYATDSLYDWFMAQSRDQQPVQH